MRQRIAVTPGEPAGIGPDILIQLIQNPQHHHLVAFVDPELLQQRAEQLALPLSLISLSELDQNQEPVCGQLAVVPHLCKAKPKAGEGVAENAAYVLACLDAAIDACRENSLDGLVTGPINKHLINAGYESGAGSFTGHTEYLAERCGVDRVVMMLGVENPKHFTAPLRVALHSTHLPLRDVPASITSESLTQTLEIANSAMQQQYGIAKPKILVCGLNPHAGENGDLGSEEIDIINPCVQALREQGLDVSDAMPADTVFTRRFIESSDVIVAMYHDQGLAPLKSHGFGAAVNITLGLPIVRTSVDHGTAFDLAGTGKTDYSSLQHAIDTAVKLCR